MPTFLQFRVDTGPRHPGREACPTDSSSQWESNPGRRPVTSTTLP